MKRLLGDRDMPFFEGFESGQRASFRTVSGSPFSRTVVTSQHQPHEGEYHLAMDSGFDGVFARNETTLAIDLEGYPNVVLRFWTRSFQDDFDTPPSGPFQEGANFDGLAVSADGFSWFPVGGFPRLAVGYSEVMFNLDETVARFGLAYNGAFRIRFNQYDNNAIPNDGVAIDDISIKAQYGGWGAKGLARNNSFFSFLSLP